MEYFFHELVYDTGQEGVVECTGLGCYPFVKVFEQLVGVV